MWVLVVLFMHHGLLIDRAHLFYDGQYETFEKCRHRSEELRAAYHDYQESTCVEVTIPAVKRKK